MNAFMLSCLVLILCMIAYGFGRRDERRIIKRALDCKNLELKPKP